MSAKTSLFRNILWMGLLQLSNLVLPLITLPIIARIIGPEKFGVINYAAAVIAYFSLLINYSFDLTATRYVAQYKSDPERIDAIFSSVLYTKIILFLGSSLAFLMIYEQLPQFENEHRVAFYSYLITVAWVVSPNWLFQGMQHLRWLAIFNLAAKLIFTVVVLALVQTEDDYVWQPLALTISQVAAGVGSFVYALRKYAIRLRPFRWEPIRATLREGQTVFYSLVTINLYTSTSVVVLGFLQDSEQVGYYSAANRLVSVAQALLFTTVNNSLFPFIGEAFGRSREEGIETVRRLVPFSFAFALLYSILIFISSPLAIRLMYGEEFEPAVNSLRILSFLPFIINCNSFFGIQAMINLKMDREFFRVTCAGAVFGLLVNGLLADSHGQLGTAAALILTEVFIFLCLFLSLRRASVSLFDYRYLNTRYLLAPVQALLRRKPKSVAVENEVP